LEDEFHVLLECPWYHELRTKPYRIIGKDMKTENKIEIRNVSMFYYEIL